MDVLLLGAMAIVLIALTLWIVWHPTSDTARREDSTAMTPMGDTFEDQYTSATADLSAGGVAVTTAHADEPAPDYVSSPLPEVLPAPEEPLMLPAPAPQRRPATFGVGAAAALTLGAAAAGAWLFARWQRERNKPINRLRRRFR
jgi:hypothetical protein